MSDQLTQTNPEIGAPDALRQQLMAERDIRILADAQKTASQACVAEMSIPLIVTEAHNNMPVGVGNKQYALSRLEKSILDTGAKKAGIKIIESDTVDRTTDEPVLAWQLEDGGRQTVRLQDPQQLLSDPVFDEAERIFRPFTVLKRQIDEGAVSAITEEDFTFTSDGDVAAVFMGLSTRNSTPGTVGQRLVADFRELTPTHYPGDEPDPARSGEGIYIDENGRITKILKEVKPHASATGVYRGVYFNTDVSPDPVDAPFKLGVEIDLARARMDASDQSSAITEPFLETHSGRDLTDALQSVGLAVSRKLAAILEGDTKTTENSKRYGNAYSELSREIAKFVNNPDRSLTSLFKGNDDELMEAVAGIDLDKVENGPAKLLLGMLQDSITRSPDDLQNSSVPVFDGFIHMSVDSCKDAEGYFLDALQSSTKLKGPRNYAVNTVSPDVEMLHKVDMGGRTAINPQPVWYKGVLLPAGSLFQRHVDATGSTQYAFVRVTAFTLSPEDARDAFTWQYVDSSSAGEKPSAQTLNKYSYIWK